MREDELKRIAGKAKVPPPFKLQAMVIEEVLTEKLRAIIARGEPRDIYDTCFLLKKGVNFNLELLNKKLELLKRDRIFDRSLFIKSLEEKKEGWKRDLVIFIPEVPPFDQVKVEIQDFLRQ
jgi:predicted nucleotidyltransferase component of viral defense system